MVTYGECNVTIDAAISADTETLLADLSIPSGKGGRIKQIRVSYANVVDAKAATGMLEVKMGTQSGPFRFPIGSGQGGATSSDFKGAETIDVDIPCLANETVKIYVTLGEAAVDGHAGIVWVGP